MHLVHEQCEFRNVHGGSETIVRILLFYWPGQASRSGFSWRIAALAFGEPFAQQEFDLGVDAAQFSRS